MNKVSEKIEKIEKSEEQNQPENQHLKEIQDYKQRRSLDFLLNLIRRNKSSQA